MAKKLTTKQLDSLKRKYLKSRGIKCPYCNSDNLFCGEVQTDDETMFRGVRCGDCNKEWTDIYRLVDITFED